MSRKVDFSFFNNCKTRNPVTLKLYERIRKFCLEMTVTMLFMTLVLYSCNSI